MAPKATLTTGSMAKIVASVAAVLALTASAAAYYIKPAIVEAATEKADELDDKRAATQRREMDHLSAGMVRIEKKLDTLLLRGR